jgi:uncharacterized membrane protein
MKTKYVLYFFLVLMAGLIITALLFPAMLANLLQQPQLYPHILFVHILATTLFFANAVVGMFWERQSLRSGKKAVILHTYATVSWLDAHLSSPLIILSVLSGISLSMMMGDLWQIGWLSSSFILFMLSGLIWVISDIPTQYRLKRLLADLNPSEEALPEALIRLYTVRWWIGLAGVLPLLIVFILMVYKPDIPALSALFKF